MERISMAQRTTRASMRPGAVTLVVGVVFSAMVMWLAGGTAGVVMAVLIGVAIARRRSRDEPAAEVIVGVDGMSWSYERGRRFAPWSVITRVEPDRGAVRLTWRGRTDSIEVDEPSALAAAALRAQEAWREREPVDVPASLLAGGSDAIGGADLARGHGALPLDLVVRVAAHPDVDARARLVAIRALGDAPESAHARVRDALDDMADLELAATLREALDRVSQRSASVR